MRGWHGLTQIKPAARRRRENAQVQPDPPVELLEGLRSRDGAPTVREKVAHLSRSGSYRGKPAAVEVVQTHMSWVFLAGDRVFKLKKPVRYPFLDYSTAEARRESCAREVLLNRRLAGAVYRRVVPLTLRDDGSLQLGGSGQAVDWLVEMRRLPAHRMLDAAIRNAAVGAGDIRRLGRVLGRFYRSASPIVIGAARYRVGFQHGIRANRAELVKPRFGLDTAPVERLARAQYAFIARHGGLLERRARTGRIVDAHGDLRPEHICLLPEPVVIDCLEFKREFRLLDPVDELAYLAMECERLGGAAVGNSVLRQYLAASGDDPEGELIAFYKVFRACLRAKIAIWHIVDHDVSDTERWRVRAYDYLRLAESYARDW
jgi:aminoglycoside phosphotransferase family enzyme